MQISFFSLFFFLLFFILTQATFLADSEVRPMVVPLEIDTERGYSQNATGQNNQWDVFTTERLMTSFYFGWNTELQCTS